MKILLKNISNTYNYGSMMMAENLISFFLKKRKDLSFYIEAFDSSDVERLREATKYTKIYKDSVLHLNLVTKNIKYVRAIEKKIRIKKHIISAAKYYDLIIILGGDDFSEVYYKFPKDNMEIKLVFDELKIYNKYSKLCMIGQTIGPYSGKRIPLAKEAFKDILIYSRDEETTKYMKATFDKEIHTSSDLAFLDLNLQKEYQKNIDSILKKYNLKKDNYITLVGTGLISNYTQNEEEMIDSFYSLIKGLKKKYKSKKIVCLSHVFTPNGLNDNNLYKRIDDKYDGFVSKNCVVINNTMLPVEARMILGNGLFTITCRMHAAVSTFQMGKPAICVAYSKKYKGVIADGLDLSELVLNAKEKNFWKNFPKTVMEKIEFIDNSKDLNKKIKNNVLKCKKNVNETLSEITESLLRG